MKKDIFTKQRVLKRSAMLTVAERRYADAKALLDTGSNARANGAAYLAGFVIEILLKAQLVSRFPEIARTPPHHLTDDQREIWGLIWRTHDLEAMLTRLPHLQAGLDRLGKRDGVEYLRELKEFCSVWDIHARYSTATIVMKDAEGLLDKVRRLKEVMK